jgi:hypothetical protein
MRFAGSGDNLAIERWCGPCCDVRIMTPSPKNHAARCRWATPTVFLDAPYWVEAEARPWACIRGGEPRPLATTDECRMCPRFEPARPYPIVLKPEWPDFFR